MSSQIHLSIIGFGNGKNKVFDLMTTNPCDGLAIMLHDKNENYRTSQKLSDILSQDEMDNIHATYGKHSVSVSEGFEKYQPIYVDPKELEGILEKIRRFYIKKLWDNDLSKDLHIETFFDVSSLSELIAALRVAKELKLQVVLTLS